jgi:hypothetical protein
MSEEELTRLAKEIIAEVLSSIELHPNVSCNSEHQLTINIENPAGRSTLSYDLNTVARWIIKEKEKEFQGNFQDADLEVDEYLSMRTSYIKGGAFDALENVLAQIYCESEDFIRGLPSVALIQAKCVLQEIEKQMFAGEVFQNQEPAQQAIDKFLKLSSKRRRKRMMTAIEVIKEQTKYDLSKMAIHYEQLLPKWTIVRDLYKQISNQKTWREGIKTTYLEDNLPSDLIDRLSSLDSYEASPSRIAMEHAARLCGVPPNTYQSRRLSQYLAESRKLHGLTTAKGPKPKVQ